MMELFQRLFGREERKIEEKQTAQILSEAVPKETQSEEPKVYPFTQRVTFGKQLFKRDEKVDVEFIHTEIRKTIVDTEGRIIDFPGIVKEKEWVEYLESEKYMEPVVRFRTSFETYGNRYLMLWQIQPDGRYWEDEDGFGGTSDLEITLYTFIDNKGDFMQPFKVYKVGTHKYFQEKQ